jgi:predicted PurR-regulated permease PerM
MSTDPRDLTRTVLMVIFILGLLLASFRIVQAFALATIWAATIVVATWPLMLRIEARCGGKRGAATAVMVGVMLVTLIVPLGLAVGSVITHRETISGWIAALPGMSLPSAPSVP